MNQIKKDNEGITFKGESVRITGTAVKEGDSAPDVALTALDMSDTRISDFSNTIRVLSVVPSLDTSVCSTQSKRFNETAKQLGRDVKVLTISRDLPFAQKRWCGAEQADFIVALSDYKHRAFGEAYGVEMPDLGLLARAVFVVDKEQKIRHVEYVEEVAQEPNYEAVLEAIAELS